MASLELEGALRSMRELQEEETAVAESLRADRPTLLDDVQGTDGQKVEGGTGKGLRLDRKSVV